MAEAGRPTKLTQQVQDKIVQAILAGNYFETACAYAGVARITGYEWLARGEGRDPRGRKTSELYARFAIAVREAEANAEVGTVANIKKALPDDGRLALEFLSRRYPDRWSAKNRHEMTGKGGGPIEYANLSDEELDRRIRELQGRIAGATSREGPPDGVGP